MADLPDIQRYEDQALGSEGMLERGPLLVELSRLLHEVAGAGGQLALVAGEAGIGKTMLVRHFGRMVERTTRVLVGACDPLSTPRPLAPLHDLAEPLRLSDLLHSGSYQPVELFGALLNRLRGPRPMVIVFEDVHWADNATLDLLRFLGRRVTTTSALVIVTYRDDEIGGHHPLRMVLGDLATASGVTRLVLRPLSLRAVATLAAGSALDAADLHQRTGGNPFFVTEVLATGVGTMPETIPDAVLARASRLPAASRAALELAAVAGPYVEGWLLEAASGCAAEAVDGCVAAGMLRCDGGRYTFRHELAREVVYAAVPLQHRRELHRAVLAALTSNPQTQTDHARLAHHAVAVGGAEAALHHARDAAKQAVSRAAHREAAAHYRTALGFAGGLPPEERAPLLEALAYECHLTNQVDEALESLHAALTCWKGLDDGEAQGRILRWLSRLSWLAGRKGDADRFADEAIAMLEASPPGPELARAYSNRSQLHMLSSEADEAFRWGERAIRLAERFGATDILAHALNNVGTAQFCAGNTAGSIPLERSLRLALDHDLQEHVGRAYTNLATSFACVRDYARAMYCYDEGIAYATERDLDAWWLYLKACRAQALLDQGRWDEAVADAEAVLAHPHASAPSRIPALAALGHVRVRRGDPQAAPVLAEGLALAERTGEIQRTTPVVAALAEGAWLAGRPEDVREVLAATYADALTHPGPWAPGLLGFWLWRLGALDALPEQVARPYALHVAGRWREAAEAWAALRSPYEQALALADGDEPAQREALLIFERLGAAPAAARLRHLMREEGLPGIPRGPRSDTRAHPAGLTARQQDVLALLAEGHTNAEIAARLFVSTKTVDNHVAAVLRKLDVSTRSQAVAEAQRRGLL